MPSMNKHRLWLLAIILLAFTIRLYNLTYHSLWFDEAISVYWARQSVPRILEVGFTLVEDRLPPLYYLLLKSWTSLTGFSEVGVRSLSVFLGTLLVPMVATIAAMLFNRRVALATALLVALNPFLIWYSQEARMYAPAVLFSTLTVWAFLRANEPANGERRTANDKWQMTNGEQQNASARSLPLGPNTQYAIRNMPHASRSTPYTSRLTFYALFILFTLAGLYSHLYTGFLLPGLGLWLVLSYPRQWRVWLPFGLSGLIIGLAFMPLALATWRFSGEGAPANPLTGLGHRAWWLLQAFTIWKAPLSPTLQIIIPTVTAIFVITAYLTRPTFNVKRLTLNTPLPLVSLLLISPFAIANLLLLRNHLAFFGERYFIIMVPWLLLLAALGAERMSEWAQRRMANAEWRIVNLSFILHPSSFILLLLLTAMPIPGQWSISAAKEAWRQSVAYLVEHATPNDGILIQPDWVRYPFQYYFHGPGQTYAAFSTVTPETALDGPLQGVVNGHRVIWLIQSHLDGPDPAHRVEQWFAARYPLVTELYPPGISLKGYAPGYQLDALPSDAIPSNLQFAGGLTLVGYQAERTVSATDDLFHPPSGWVHVILYWTAAKPISGNIAPFVHLVGPEGVWGASLERETDALKLFPPSRWSVGQIIRHDVDVNLNPATPPGAYQLVVGFSDQEFPLTEIEVR